MGMRQEQAKDEAKDFVSRNFEQVNVLVWGVADRATKFFDGFLSQKQVSDKLWGMITQALEEHYGNSGKLFVAVNDSGLRVEVHGSLDFIDLTKDPHIDIYLLLGTTDEKKAPKKEEEKVEQHPADRAVGALLNEKEGGPIGHT
jgi:hypothetical protein